MKKLASSAVIAALVVACSSDDGAVGGGSTDITGTIGGKPFTAKSGFFVMKNGKVTLEFSNFEGLCADVTAAKLRANTQLIQFYFLETPGDGGATDQVGNGKAALGPVLSSDMKYAAFGSCTSGEALQENVIVGTGRAEKTSTSITLTALGADKVAGTLDVTFDDGSKIRGSFSVPACSAQTKEESTCL
jgi:hypothetical protein